MSDNVGRLNSPSSLQHLSPSDTLRIYASDTLRICLFVFSHHDNVGHRTAGMVSVWFTALTLVLHYKLSKYI